MPGQFTVMIQLIKFVFMHLRDSIVKFDFTFKKILASGLIIQFQSLKLVSKLQITLFILAVPLLKTKDSEQVERVVFSRL